MSKQTEVKENFNDEQKEKILSAIPRFNTLSNEELISLTDEEIQRYIDIEIALEHIIPVKHPGEKPVKPEPVKSITCYKVGDLYFETMEQAELVLNQKPFGISYESNIGYEFKYKEDSYSNFYVEREIIYSKDEIKELVKNSENLLKKHKIYEEQEKMYKIYQEEVSRISNKIYGAVEDAVSFNREVQRCIDLFNHYYNLTKDHNTSLILLKDAWNNEIILDVALKSIEKKDEK